MLWSELCAGHRVEGDGRLQRHLARWGGSGLRRQPPGARLLLQEEIVFNNVTFFGHLSVRGVAVLNKACVKMQSGTVVAGATLRVENCTNGNVWSSGGGVCARSLRVDGDLEIHQSHARCGGGVYVDGLSTHLTELPRRRS